jgi:hypothetical protein
MERARFALAERSLMTKKRFDNLSEAEFGSLVDGYFERTDTGYGEVRPNSSWNYWLNA